MNLGRVGRLFNIALPLLLAGHGAMADTQIDVFTDGPVTVPATPHTRVQVWDLSQAEVVEARSPKFSPDPAIAEAQAKAWLASSAGVAFMAQMREAHRSLEQLFRCEIARVPAVAFDGCRFVVYGTTDVAAAVQDYDQYRKTHPISAAVVGSPELPVTPGDIAEPNAPPPQEMGL